MTYRHKSGDFRVFAVNLKETFNESPIRTLKNPKIRPNPKLKKYHAAAVSGPDIHG